jgi:hypothetical protein
MARRYLSGLGLVPYGKDGWQKNASKINSFIAADHIQPGDTMVGIPGEYPLGETIYQRNKNLNWELDGMTFLIYHNGDGFVLENKQPHALTRSHFDRLSVVNRDKGSVGFRSNSLVTMYFPVCSSFRSHGMHLHANEDGEDLSGSILILPTCGANGGDGIKIEGGDANQILLVLPTCAGNGGIGINDWSFLGITLIAPMCHNNVGGDYHTESLSARTMYLNPYGEEGGPINEIHGGSNVIGGLVPNGWKANEQSTIQTGRGTSHMNFGPLRFVGDGDKVNVELGKNGTSYSMNLSLSNPDHNEVGCPHYVLNGYITGKIIDLFEAHWDYPTQYGTRKVTFGSLGVPHMFIGERLFIFGTPDTVARLKNFEFRNGDTILNQAYDGVLNDTERWVRISNIWKPIKITL